MTGATCRLARSVAGLSTLALTLFGAGRVLAQASADASAFVLFPLISVDESVGIDTVITLTNTGSDPVAARCFYQDNTPPCDDAGNCIGKPGDCDGGCNRAARVTEFVVDLTKNQPTAWRVSAGRQEFVSRFGADGQRGDSSGVPGLGQGPLTAVLRCFAADERGAPTGANVLSGSARVETRTGAKLDAFSYEALGLAGVLSTGNSDSGVILGGDAGVLAGCPGVASVPVLFDFATLENDAGDTHLASEFVIVPCGVELGGSGLTAGAASKSARFFVLNEFGQAFSSSAVVENQLIRSMSSIDSERDPTRSIFTVMVNGTISGQVVTRLVASREDPVSRGGMAMLLIEHHESDDGTVSSAAIEPSYGRPAADGDLVTFGDVQVCAGDCNEDGRVAIEDLILGVNVALSRESISACLSIDGDGDGSVAVSELVRAVRSNLDDCLGTPGLLPARVPVPSPPVPPVGEDGPTLTYFGLVTASGFRVAEEGTDDAGRPIYVQPHGQGFSIVVEASTDATQAPAGPVAYSGDPDALNDLQLILSRPIGDGSSEVCDLGRPAGGGVPATVPLEFSDDVSVIRAINDLTCRVADNAGAPRARSSRWRCTRSDTPGGLGEVADPGNRTIQYCLPIARAWAFPPGDTIVAARTRDLLGAYGEVGEIVVRVRGDR